MSACLKKNALMLSLLAQAKPCMCKAIIGAADQDLITCLCECAQNILNGNVPLSKAHLKQLHQYRTDVRNLAKSEQPNIPKRKSCKREDF